MKIRRKTKVCLNCDANLSDVYNYCPNCGQENNDNNVSLKTLIGDFFNTYLAIDSRFGRSFKPFFTKPGELTLKYTGGKRVSYAHPVRFYLIVSIFYFFTVTIAAHYLADDEEDAVIKSSNTNLSLDKINGLPDSTKLQIISSLSSRQKSQLKNEMKDGDLEDLEAFLINLDSSRQYKVRQAIGSAAADSLGLLEEPEVEKPEVENDNSTGFNVDLGADEDFILEKVDFAKIKKLDEEYGNIKDRQIYDSLNMGELSSFEELIVMQTIRINRADSEQVMDFVVKNLPLMMLVLIPLFGLVLKLFYIRRDHLYIKHVVHALHLHTFAYLVYGTFILITVYLINDEDFQPILNILAFIIVSVYTYISFRRVYQQHWFKTFIKFFLVGQIYLFSISLFFLIEMVISLLLY